MPISDAVREDVARRLLNDIRGTIGDGHERVVHERVVDASIASAPAHLIDPSDYERWVIEDVQQYVHDCFVDTSWPSCPHHPHHPLWVRPHAGGCSWFCAELNTAVARVGELRGRN